LKDRRERRAHERKRRGEERREERRKGAKRSVPAPTYKSVSF
jgi:hypothetical protein